MDISIDGWIDGFNLNMAMFPLVNQRVIRCGLILRVCLNL